VGARHSGVAAADWHSAMSGPNDRRTLGSGIDDLGPAHIGVSPSKPAEEAFRPRPDGNRYF
jgi:hypothetical protein